MTWTNVDLSSVRSTNIHLRVISHDIPQQSVTKIIYLKFHSILQAKDFPEANEFIDTKNKVWHTATKREAIICF